MHRFYSDLNVAYPALFRWILWIPIRVPSAFDIFTLVIIVVLFTIVYQPRIGGIGFHGLVGIANREAHQAAEDYGAGDRNRQRQEGRHHQEVLHDQGWQEDPGRELRWCVGWGKPIFPRRSYRIGHVLCVLLTVIVIMDTRIQCCNQSFVAQSRHRNSIRKGCKEEIGLVLHDEECRHCRRLKRPHPLSISFRECKLCLFFSINY